jgi:hypothetical protein
MKTCASKRTEQAQSKKYLAKLENAAPFLLPESLLGAEHYGSKTPSRLMM